MVHKKLLLLIGMVLLVVFSLAMPLVNAEDWLKPGSVDDQRTRYTTNTAPDVNNVPRLFTLDSRSKIENNNFGESFIINGERLYANTYSSNATANSTFYVLNASNFSQILQSRVITNGLFPQDRLDKLTLAYNSIGNTIIVSTIDSQNYYQVNASNINQDIGFFGRGFWGTHYPPIQTPNYFVSSSWQDVEILNKTNISVGSYSFSLTGSIGHVGGTYDNNTNTLFFNDGRNRTVQTYINGTEIGSCYTLEGNAYIVPPLVIGNDVFIAIQNANRGVYQCNITTLNVTGQCLGDGTFPLIYDRDNEVILTYMPTNIKVMNASNISDYQSYPAGEVGFPVLATPNYIITRTHPRLFLLDKNNVSIQIANWTDDGVTYIDPDSVAVKDSCIYLTANGTIYKIGFETPFTYLVSPENNSRTSINSTSFTCEASDLDGLFSLALRVYNSTGSLIVNDVNMVSGTYNKTNWTIGFPYYDTYTWTCIALDTLFNPILASENRTLIYDLASFSFWYETLILQNEFSVLADTLIHTLWNDTLGELTLEDYERFNYPTLNGFWEFNEGSGTNVEDISSYGNNGTINNLNNGVKWTSEGRFGNALEFNKTNGNVTVNSSKIILVDNLTVELWVKVHKGDTLYNDLVTQLGGTSSFFFLIDNQGYPYGALYGTFAGGYTQARGSVNLYDDAWHHLVWTFNGNALKLYVDGTLSDTDTETGVITQSNDDIYFGSRQAGGHELNGTLDNVMILNRSLSLDEIKELHYYHGNITSQIYNTGLLADWDFLSMRVWDRSLRDDRFNMTGNKILYHFEETSGNAIDSSGNGLNGTVYNCLRNQEGKFSKAYYYDGAGDYVDIVGGTTNSISGDQTHTISMWFKPSQFTGYPMLLDACPGLASGMNIQIGSSSVMYWRYGTNYRRYTLSTNMVLDEWQHLVCVKTGAGDSGKMYLNGVLQTSWTAWFTDMPGGAYDMQIGRYSNVGTYDYRGWIDEFAVWDRSLSATEVIDLYDSSSSGFNVSVRTCDDALCSGENWNNLGLKRASSELSWDLSSIQDNQYFQYQIELRGQYRSSPILNNVSINWELGTTDDTNFSYWINETSWPAEAIYPGWNATYPGGAYFRNLTGAVELFGNNLSGIVQSQIWDSGTATRWEWIYWQQNEIGELPNFYNYKNDFDMSNIYALWHLNDNKTATEYAKDNSGNNFDARVYGDTDCSVDGKFQRGCHVDGNTDYFFLQNSGTDIANDYTMALWINSTVNNVWQGTLGHNNFRWRKRADTNTMSFWDTATGYCDGSIVVPINNWTHLAIKRVGDNVSLWLNGEMDGNCTGFNTINYGDDWYFGRSYTTGQDFEGGLDEVVMFNRGLSDQEIKDLYDRGKGALTFQVRSCNDAVCLGDPWLNPSSEMPTNLSSVITNNRYFQFQFNLSREDSEGSPRLFNVSVFFDRQDHWVNIVYPQSITYPYFVTELNYTYENLDFCWWSNNSGLWNSTRQVAGLNWSGLTSVEGLNNWTVYCNSTLGDTAEDSVTFYINTTPDIMYVPPTPTHLSVLNNGTFCQNVTLTETYFQNITFRIYDGSMILTEHIYTNGTRMQCYAGLPDDTYYINATVCTTTGKCNSTETRTIIINAGGPMVSNFSAEDIHTNISGPWTMNWTYNVSDPSLESCWYYTDENSTNISVACNTGPYFTNFTNEGHHNITYCANNTLGQITCGVGVGSIYYFRWTQSDNPDPTADGVSTLYTLTLAMTDIGTNWPDTNATLWWGNQSYPLPVKIINADSIVFTQAIIIPLGTGSSTGTVIPWNWTYMTQNSTIEYNDWKNLDYATNRTTTETTTVYTLNINDCITGNGTIILNYSLIDEETREAWDGNISLVPNASIELHIVVRSVADESIIWEYHSTRTNFSYYNDTPIAQVCVDNVLLNASATNYSYYLMDVVTRYECDDHVYEYNYFDRAYLNSSSGWNVSLHDLDNAHSTSFLITYKNEYYLPVEDCTIDLHRYYVGDGEYISVEHAKTDEYGQTRLHMVTEDVKYKAYVKCQNETSRDYELVWTSPVFLALCQQTPCTVNFQKEGDVEDLTNYSTVGNLAFSVTLDRPTRNVDLVYTTLDGTPVTMNLSLIQLDAYLNKTVCTNSQTSSGGGFNCTVPSTPNSNVTYVVDIYRDDVSIFRTYFSLTPHAYDTFGGTGVIMTGLLYMTLVLMAVSSGIGIIVFGIVGLIFASLLTIFQGGSIIGAGSSIMWLIIAGTILIIKIHNRRSG